MSPCNCVNVSDACSGQPAASVVSASGSKSCECFSGRWQGRGLGPGCSGMGLSGGTRGTQKVDQLLRCFQAVVAHPLAVLYRTLGLIRSAAYRQTKEQPRSNRMADHESVLEERSKVLPTSTADTDTGGLRCFFASRASATTGSGSSESCAYMGSGYRPWTDTTRAERILGRSKRSHRTHARDLKNSISNSQAERRCMAASAWTAVAGRLSPS